MRSSVPLNVTHEGEVTIRVQLYEESPETNIDVDGATLY